MRRHVYDNYKSLGLKSKPNVGLNGVHASASPFEGLAERLNWVGAQLETDGFGKAMLAADISKEMVLDWTNDPQVLLIVGSRVVFHSHLGRSSLRMERAPCLISSKISTALNALPKLNRLQHSNNQFSF